MLIEDSRGGISFQLKLTALKFNIEDRLSHLINKIETGKTVFPTKWPSGRPFCFVLFFPQELLGGHSLVRGMLAFLLSQTSLHFNLHATILGTLVLPYFTL